MHYSSLIKTSLLSSLILLFSTLTQIGCSVRSFALRTASNSLLEATTDLEAESDWEMFQRALPGNLKLMSGLLSLEPENRPLLASLVKGYAAYAFGVSETLFLNEKLADIEGGPLKDKAVRDYSKAVYYGLKYFTMEGIKIEDLNKCTTKEKCVAGILDDKLNKNDKEVIETLLYFTQAWASLANIRKDDSTLIGQAFIIKEIADWGCKHQPDFQQGFCQIFLGSYECMRPKMLGGNPDKGKKAFLEGIKKYPKSLLIRVAFIENYVISMQDEKEYQTQKAALLQEFKALEAKPYVPGKTTVPESDLYAKPQMLNSIAHKRFSIISSLEKKIF